MELSPIFEGLELPRPIVISGPCSAETEEQVIDTARRLAACGVKIFRAGIWKPRTKPGGFEGVGEACFAWLDRVKRETGMKTAVEVASAHHVELALKAGVDVLWIGARTATNPFAVQDIADALKGKDTAVLVKNPMNPDLELWIGALERIANAGIKRLGAIHRGFSEYEHTIYRNAPQWRIPIELRRRIPGLPIFCDPSHMGGRRDLIAPLSQEAMDLGFDGLIVETHCNPDCAWSDKNQQITPETLAGILSKLVIRDTNNTELLAELRCEIDRIDTEVLALLSRRMQISRDIGNYKKEHGLSVLQAQRYNELLDDRAKRGAELNLDQDFVKAVLRTIHDESVRLQIEIINK